MMNKTTWQRVKLGEICSTIDYGYTTSATNLNTGVKFLRITDIVPNMINWDSVPYCEIDFDKKEKYLLEAGDIVIARTGATTGYNKIIKHNDFQAVFASYLIRYKINSNLANPYFIFYHLQSLAWKGFVEGIIGGSAQPNANAKQFADFSFPLPPLETQQRIAEILSSLDDKIDLLHRQNKTLESLSLTLFRHTFIDNPKRNEWQIGKLGDYVTPKKGKNITQKNATKGIYPVIAGGLEPAYYHNQSNTQSPVITISASGANAGFVNIHYCPVWSSDSSYIDSTITPYIYFSYLFLKHNQNILYDKQEGSAQPHIYPSHIMELEMPHYPKELMESFETQIQVYFNKISHNMKEIQSLESLRDIMLPKLLSGEMEV